MEKALFFNGGVSCTNHSKGICTEGKSSNTYKPTQIHVTTGMLTYVHVRQENPCMVKALLLEQFGSPFDYTGRDPFFLREKPNP